MKRIDNKDTVVEHYGRVIEHITVAYPDLRNILVTSAEPREGRTTTAIGLAFAAALLKPNKRILLVDLDLRHPVLHEILGLGNTLGIREVIADRLRLEDVLSKTHLVSLTVITSGTEAVDFPEAFKSEPMNRFLNDARSLYDIAIYDSPPINSHVDAHIMSGIMDGTILLIRSDRSKRDEVTTAKRKLESANGKVVGAIMNDFRNPLPSFLERYV